MGWGFQAGGEVTDFILVLATTGTYVTTLHACFEGEENTKFPLLIFFFSLALSVSLSLSLSLSFPLVFSVVFWSFLFSTFFLLFSFSSLCLLFSDFFSLYHKHCLSFFIPSFHCFFLYFSYISHFPHVGAVEAFSSKAQVILGTELAVALGRDVISNFILFISFHFVLFYFILLYFILL